MSDSSTNPDSSQNQLSYVSSIGLTTSIFLVVANMIGSGVFTTSGFSLQSLGSPKFVFAAWIVGGVIALCGAVSYGALGKHFRKSGGEYLFLSHSIHPAAGFIAGWVSIVAGFTGAIAYSSKVFASYFLPLVNSDWNAKDQPWLFLGTAILVIALAAFAHAMKFRFGVMAQNTLVCIKLSLLAVLIFFAFTAPDVVQTSNTEFDLGKFAVAIMWISFSYTGYNAVVYAASEVRNVEKTLPLATLLGTLLVTAIYLLLNYVFVYKVPMSLTTGKLDIAAICAGHLGGIWLEKLTRVIISLATTTSVFAMVMLGPRVFALMAQDGWLPKSYTSPTSPRSLATQAGLAIAVTIIFTLYAKASDLLSYLGMMLSLSAALSVVSLFVLKARGVQVKVPLWPLPPIVFVLSTVALIITAGFVEPLQALSSVNVIVVGLVIFSVLNRRKKLDRNR